MIIIQMIDDDCKMSMLNRKTRDYTELYRELRKFEKRIHRDKK